MGWGQFETTIEHLREEVGRDPAAAAESLVSVLERADLRPRDRTRLYGLLSAARKHLGDETGAEAALEAGKQVRRTSSLARAELAMHDTALRIAQRRWAAALTSAAHVLELLPPACHADSDWGRRQQRTRNRLFAAAHVHRGQILLINQGDVAAALEEARAALDAAPPPRQRLAAVVLLSRATCRGGTVKELLHTAKLLEETTATYPSTDRIVHAECRIARAVIVARFGATAQAEALIRESLEEYRKLGALHEYRSACEMLIWLVSERDAKPGRARLLARQLRLHEPRQTPR